MRKKRFEHLETGTPGDAPKAPKRVLTRFLRRLEMPGQRREESPPPLPEAVPPTVPLETPPPPRPRPARGPKGSQIVRAQVRAQEQSEQQIQLQQIRERQQRAWMMIIGGLLVFLPSVFLALSLPAGRRPPIWILFIAVAFALLRGGGRRGRWR